MEPEKISLNLKDLADLSASAIHGKPVTTTGRGIERSHEALTRYSADPSTWPLTKDGELSPQLCWGGFPHPLSRANLHFLIAGVPGTGKTLSIRLLLQSIFGANVRSVLPGGDRAVVYDPKLEFYPIFRGIGIGSEQLILLNPFDARGDYWDIAADYTSPAEAYQLARSLISVPENHQQPFFPKAAAAIFAAVASVHMRHSPGKWDLALLLRWCSKGEAIAELLASDPGNPLAEMVANFLVPGTTRDNVMAELSSHLIEFQSIAACWRKARDEGRKPFSVKSFLDTTDRIVLLGANQTHSVALAAINRLLLKRLAEQTMDHSAQGQREAMNRTWLVLDETRELGKVPGLADFINKGRSRGVCAVLGFQDYAGMKEAFGENVAHELTATCAHKLFLRLGSESAEWASRSIGRAEVQETTTSRSVGNSSAFNQGSQDGRSFSAHGNQYSDGTSRGISIQSSLQFSTSTVTRETDAVMASEIAHLPGFEEGDGLHGFLCRSAVGGLAQVHRLAVTRDYFDDLIPPTDDPGYVPRPAAHQDLFAVMDQ